MWDDNFELTGYKDKARVIRLKEIIYRNGKEIKQEIYVVTNMLEHDVLYGSNNFWAFNLLELYMKIRLKERLDLTWSMITKSFKDDLRNDKTLISLFNNSG